MDNNEYKISLGVKLNIDDLQGQVNDAGKNIKPIDIKVDAETKELTKTINEALKTLSSGAKNVLTIDTTKLENSLGEVSSTIKEIKSSIGMLDSKSGMQSLLSSINQISTALDKAVGKFDELNVSLKALSSKDFSVNIGVKLGGGNTPTNNAEFGSYVRQKVFPELHNQEQALIDYLSKYYNTGEINVLNKLAGDSLGGVKGIIETLERLEKPIKKGDNLTLRMEEYQNFFNAIKKGADIHGVDLSPVISTFSEDADTLVKTANDIRSGANVAKDSMNSLKDAFGVEGFSAQLDSIVKDLNEIKIAIQGLSSGASLGGLTTSFDNLSNSIELLIKNCANMKVAVGDGISGLNSSVGGTNGSLEKTENSFKEITITAGNSADAIQSLRNAMASMKFNTSSIDAATQDLKEADIVIEKISAKNGKNFDITIKGVNELGEAVTVIKRLNDATGQFEVISTQISKPFDEGTLAVKNFKKEAETVKNIKINIETGKYDDDLSRLNDGLSKLSHASESSLDNLRENIKAVENAYKAMEAAATPDSDGYINKEKLIKAEQDYAKALEATNNLLRIQTREQKAIDASKKLEDDRRMFQLDVDAWMTKNSAATKKFGNNLRELKAKAQSCDRVDLNHFRSELKRIDKEADKLGLKMQSLPDRIKTKFKEYSAYFSVAEVFMYVTQGLRDMFDQVVAIDSAMTELKKVTNETDASYNHFLSNAGSKAKELGTTIDGLVSSTADFARLGYGFKESQGLAEVANIYAVVGDDIDSVETATQSLISTLTAFKNEANGLSDSDFAMSIVDKMNEVSNNFAISSGGIGDALQRSASSMMAANNSLDETIALITAANTVVQDPDAVGRLMPTLKMAISVKLQRWTRPRKDFISIFTTHQLGRMCIFCAFK